MSRRPLPPALPPIEDGPAWREYLLLALTCAATFAACYQPLWDPDTYWHLAVGREIWQTGHLLRTQALCFTAQDLPWEDTEWLFHVLVYPIWKIGGDVGLGLVTALLGSSAVALAYRAVRAAGGNAAVHGFYFIALLGTYQTRIRMRPDLFSLVFMAILVEGLVRWKPGGPRWGRFVVFLTALFWVWAQCHGGWAFGMALLGACLAGWALDGIRERWLGPRVLCEIVLAGIAPAAAIFANPYGWRIPWFPLKSLMGFWDPNLVQIAEWERTPFEGTYLPLLFALAFLAVASLLEWHALTWQQLLWLGSQAFLGLCWVRYTAFAIVSLAPVAAMRVRPLLRIPLAASCLWALALLAAAVAVGYDLATVPTQWDLSQRYPVSEAQFLQREKVPGNLLNTYDVGGYLDWFAYPQNRPFMDGRYYPFIRPLKDFYEAHNTVEGYEKFLSAYRFDAAIFPHPDYLLRVTDPEGIPWHRGPSVSFYPAEEWALVHFGNYGMLFLRREPRYGSVISACEYKVLRPDDLAYLAKAALRGKVDADALGCEIRRKLKEDPWTGFRPKLQKVLDEIEALRAPASE